MYGIFTYIWLIIMVNVGTVNIPYMDGMGIHLYIDGFKPSSTGRIFLS